MKRLVIFILLMALTVLPVAATQAVTTADDMTTIPEEPEPTDTSEYVDMTEEFLNINIWLFRIAAVALVICTVVFIVLKIKKHKNKKNQA